MFAPDHAQAGVRDGARVPHGRAHRPGQLDPEGFIGQLFKILGRHLPPPPGVQSPALWGPKRTCTTLFGDTAVAIR